MLHVAGRDSGIAITPLTDATHFLLETRIVSGRPRAWLTPASPGTVVPTDDPETCLVPALAKADGFVTWSLVYHEGADLAEGKRADVTGFVFGDDRDFIDQPATHFLLKIRKTEGKTRRWLAPIGNCVPGDLNDPGVWSVEASTAVGKGVTWADVYDVCGSSSEAYFREFAGIKIHHSHVLSKPPASHYLLELRAVDGINRAWLTPSSPHALLDPADPNVSIVPADEEGLDGADWSNIYHAHGSPKNARRREFSRFFFGTPNLSNA